VRYYLIAGEASGDLHASNLVTAIRALDPAAEFRGFGGDKMQANGVELVRHYKETAYMGFVEVFLHLRAILKNIALCKTDILHWKPDVVIPVDYPGFNLRITPFAKQHGFKVCYYISPQLWAWKSSRVEIIKRSVDTMLVILPFEEAFYKNYQYPVNFVGHPLLDAMAQFQPASDFEERHGLKDRKYIALLPGSRKQEIVRMLPEMLSITESFPEHQFVVACAPAMDDAIYLPFAKSDRIKFIRGATYDILKHADAALVTSGTATLETALWNIPQVVCYKGSGLSYMIARQLVKVKYISLVNLIADSLVVPELIQQDLNAHALESELKKILPGADGRTAMLENYLRLKDALGGPGASDRAAQKILETLRIENSVEK